MSPRVLGKAVVYLQSHGIWQPHSSTSGGYSFQSHCTDLLNPITEELLFPSSQIKTSNKMLVLFDKSKSASVCSLQRHVANLSN